jgi:mRNA interferase MazF
VARLLRGEIRWADLNPVKGKEQAGLRPVVILSQDVFNERSGTVIAMAITSLSQRAGFPLALELDSNDLPKRSWVNQPNPHTFNRANRQEDRYDITRRIKPNH